MTRIVAPTSPHNQSSEDLARLMDLWATIPPKATEYVVVEQGNER